MKDNHRAAGQKARKAAASPRSSSLPAANHDHLQADSEQNDSAGKAPLAVDPGRLLSKIGSGHTRHEYLVDECVFSQGDSANAVYYILSGKLKLTVVSQGGKEAVVAILSEGSFFGEGCLVGQLVRMATAAVLQKSMIVRVEKSIMVNLLRDETEFAEQFLTHLLIRNIRMEADLVDHLFNSSEKRLARLLLLMANFGQESRPIPVIAKISQETLAEMIGTTRSRVSFFLNRFRELGFIDYNGSAGMQVHSSLVSVVLHD
jgi:CRP/FNR family transcriptional regulator, cyclic AMP receptor protein